MTLLSTTRGLRQAWLCAAAFLGVFVGNFWLHTGPGPTRRMWLLFEALVLAASLAVLVRQRWQPRQREILVAALFAGLVGFAYLGLARFSIHSWVAAIVTFTTGLAALLVFRRHPAPAIVVLKSGSARDVLASVAIGAGTGLLLGAVNLWLMQPPGPWQGDFSWRYVQVALSPAVFEEVAFRMFPYALALQLLHGRQETKQERLVAWGLMIVPHALIHTPEYFLRSPMNGLITTAVLCLLFGWPFAWLQRKRDLTAAMIAHGVVDLLRFCFLGLPV